MKRFIALFLIFVLSLTFIAGCETAEDVSSEIISESIESEESKVVVKNLRIGTYNIANGRDVNWDFKQIADDIIENDLDIVGLQEVDQLCNRSKRSDTIKILSVSTGMKYYAFFKCINYDGGEYGTAILSKYPIIDTEEIELNNGAKVERRLLTLAKIDVDGTVFNFFNTHLTVASDEIRADEFKLVAEAVKDKPNCILTGDFNVDSYEEFENLAISPKVQLCLVAQTTFNYNKFQELVEKISRTSYDINVLNTICNATQERQVEAKKVASQVEVMLVIGGKHSSNTQKLYEICQKECKNTYYIQTIGDLNPECISSACNVGITAGASTPNNIIEEVHTNVRVKF